MQDRIDDNPSFGMQYVGLINPRNAHTFVYTVSRMEEVKNGVLTTKDAEIRVF